MVKHFHGNSELHHHTDVALLHLRIVGSVIFLIDTTNKTGAHNIRFPVACAESTLDGKNITWDLYFLNHTSELSREFEQK